MKIIPTTIDDIPNILSIRNSEETRVFLDDDRLFSIENGLQWFKTTNPKWFSLRLENQFIGYIRTTWHGFKSVGIGCDIHPDYRGKGYGNHALNWIIVQLLSKGVEDIWLQVFEDNTRALNLYKKLGFVVTGNLTTRGKPAFKMELQFKSQKMDFLTILDKPHSFEYLEYFKKGLSFKTIEPNFKYLDSCHSIDLTQGSVSHANGIEYLTSISETENFVIFDYDTKILCKNWDKIISFLMNQYVAIGTEYPHSYKKYIEFPTLFFSVWNTKLWKKINPELHPQTTFDRNLSNYRFAENFDIGVALPSYYKYYKSNYWDYREYKGLEIYFCYDVPFVTHLGRGSTRDFSHPRNISWRQTIEEIQNV